MCNKFAVKSREALLEKYGLLPPLPPLEDLGGERLDRPIYAPTNMALGLTNAPKSDPARAEYLRWGFLSFDGRPLTCARSETIDEKRAYASAWKARRCVLLVDAFFEYEGPKNHREPVMFSRADGEPMAFAGLWEDITDPKRGRVVRAATVATVEPNALVGAVHDRMPVILERDQIGRWLNGAADLEASKKMLVAYAADRMRAVRLAGPITNDNPDVWRQRAG